MDDYDYELASEIELQIAALWRQLRICFPTDVELMTEEYREDIENAAELGLLGSIPLTWEMRLQVLVLARAVRQALSALGLHWIERRPLERQQPLALSPRTGRQPAPDERELLTDSEDGAENGDDGQDRTEEGVRMNSGMVLDPNSRKDGDEEEERCLQAQFHPADPNVPPGVDI